MSLISQRPNGLAGEEELEMATRLAHVHLDLLAVHEELTQVAEEEAPTAASFVEVSLTEKRQLSITADAVESLLVSDAPSLGPPAGPAAAIVFFSLGRGR
jgi:hypothetical protein